MARASKEKVGPARANELANFSLTGDIMLAERDNITGLGLRKRKHYRVRFDKHSKAYIGQGRNKRYVTGAELTYIDGEHVTTAFYVS